MLSPPDYVSLAELWKEFFQKFRLPLTHVAFEKYGGEDFALGDEFGSPDDFCEDAFLSTFNELPVFVANPDGQVMRMETVLSGGRSKLFQKMSALESYIAASNPDEAGLENYWLRKLGSEDFEPWDTSTQTISDWKAKYLGSVSSLLPQVRFHTLPFVFERGRYVVPDEAPPWLSDVLDEHILPDVAERFGGRSLCLDLQSAKAWRITVIQKQSVLRSLEGQGNLEPKRGRPAKKRVSSRPTARSTPRATKGV
ncbi:hypothetical protein E7681_17715 [Thalassobius vesicularis]|uniref:Uncharacterized protein n=1 Tax=Thalassobius vesicularis TaxID=1294297 RepID=A0A4S3M534_9RHOB|nr:hypothetical protein [Thalassobius vesicularis]THD71638.1 hypothetical protein E7681_17715 [Thalassobius vesicularis]